MRLQGSVNGNRAMWGDGGEKVDASGGPGEQQSGGGAVGCAAAEGAAVGLRPGLFLGLI